MDVPDPSDTEFRSSEVRHGEQEGTDAQHMRRLQRARQARLGKLIVAIVILIGLVVFCLQNSQPVEVELLFTTIHPRLVWVLLACAIVGGIVGGIVGYLIARPSRQVRLHTKPRRR